MAKDFTMNNFSGISIIFAISLLLVGCGGGGGGESNINSIAISKTPSAAVAQLQLPECNANDPEVLFITQAADFDFINNPNYRVFCVYPGNYSSAGRIHITSSGQDNKPRVIRWYNPGSSAEFSNPVANQDIERVILSQLFFQNAQQWIVHGLTIHGASDFTELLVIGASSSNNIFDSMLIEQGGVGTQALVEIRDGAHYNVIQNSVIRNSSIVPGKDRNCLNLTSTIPDGEIRGTLIVANEIYNCTDGIQLVIRDDTTGSHYPQTIISDNDIYITPDMYTDCNGNFYQHGDCAAAENGIDIKSGSTGSEDTVIIQGNRFWGFRKTDANAGGSGSWGDAIGTCCFHPAYILMENNIIMDSARGISSTNGHHISIINNLIYTIRKNNIDNTGQALVIYGSNHEAYLNIVIDSDQWGALPATDADYRCNTFIRAGSHNGSGNTSGVIADFNAYYESVELALPGTQDIVEIDTDLSHNTDHCFVRKRWTAPELICIPLGSVTTDSPHYLNCDIELGSRQNIGVDNRIYQTASYLNP